MKNVLLLLSLAASAAGAQTVWRCGNSYGTQPCGGGTAVDVTDTRTPAEAAQARKTSADDMRRAEAMEKSRLAAEKNAPKALVIGPKEAPPPVPKEQAKPHKGKKKDGKKDPELFTASAPGEPKKKK